LKITELQQTVDFLKDTFGKRTAAAIAGNLTPFVNNSFDNALFLSYLIVSMAESPEEEWVSITFEDWEDLDINRAVVEKARYYFHNLEILEYKVKKNGQGNTTTHYKVNYETLLQELSKPKSCTHRG